MGIVDLMLVFYTLNGVCGPYRDSLDLFRALRSKKDGKDQETIQSSTPPDPGYHIGK